MNRQQYKFFAKIFLVILLFASNIFAQLSIEKRIANLSNVDKSVIVDSTLQLCWDIYIQPTDTAKKYGGVLLAKTKELDIESYLRVKSFLLNYNKENYLQKLDSIYIAAKENNLTRLMASVYELKSNHYKQIEKYDSSMAAILNARKLYQKVGTLNELVASMQTIADLYFSAGLYNEAEEIYKEIIKLRGDEGQWKFWRKRVIRNNLALIDIERGKYTEAITKFNTSLSEVQNGNTNKIDSIAASYLYSELANVYYLKNDFSDAKINYKLGINYATNLNQNKFASKLYLTKSKILFDEAKYDSSFYYALLSSEQLNETFSDLSSEVELTTHKAYLFEKLGNKEEHIIHLQKALLLSTELATKMNKWKYMQLLAKSEYENLNLVLENKKSENILLLLGGITITVILIFVFVLNYRLRKANLELVRKSLLTLERDKKVSDNYKESNDGEETGHLNELIEILQSKMKNDKLFLRKDLTIQKLSEELETNRSYLSKAINSNLKISFVNYINNLRIAESIRLIESGFFKNYKIEGIADHCGFNSRSAFIKAFAAYTGVTPSFFIRNYNKSIQFISNDFFDEK